MVELGLPVGRCRESRQCRQKTESIGDTEIYGQAKRHVRGGIVSGELRATSESQDDEIGVVRDQPKQSGGHHMHRAAK